MSDGKVRSLSDLPREVSPGRDLWPQLQSRLIDAQSGNRRRHGALAAALRPLAAVAALAVAVAAGISIDRGLLRATHVPASTAERGAGPQAVPAFLADPGYLREREALLRSLDARLANLPPQSRQEVLSSLATIDRSMREIQAALGREPDNELLQELLIDTYQDEMRVLTTVQDVSAGGET